MSDEAAYRKAKRDYRKANRELISADNAYRNLIRATESAARRRDTAYDLFRQAEADLSEQEAK